MSANLDLGRDIARRLRETWADWFGVDTEDMIADVVRCLSPGALKSTTTVAAAIIKAQPFTDYLCPKDRESFALICEDIDPLLNDYARFCERQMVLEPLVAKRVSKRPKKALPPTPAQKRALEAYFAKIAHHTAMANRTFPPNVVDLVAYRAMHC